VAWSVYQIAHRPLDLGLVGLALFLPSLLLVVVTGTVVDRFDRKAIVLMSASMELFGAVALAWLNASGNVRLETVLPILFGIGVAAAFGATAERTLLINIVEDDRFVRMSALYGSAREVVVIGAPAVGGVLVALSAATALETAVALRILSIGAFMLVRLRRSVAPVDRPSWRAALDGIRFVRSQPVLLGAISLDLCAVLLGGATALLPVYATDILHVGPVGFGILRSSVAVGAFATGLILHRFPPLRRVGTLLLVAVAGFGVATLVFAFARQLWIATAALAAIGAFDMVSVVIRNGIVQLNTPDAMRGRVSAIEMVFIGASNELGEFESGALAQMMGAIGAVAAGGIATLLIVGLWAAVFPALRDSDRLAPESPS
jgi:MFS family permease